MRSECTQFHRYRPSTLLLLLFQAANIHLVFVFIIKKEISLYKLGKVVLRNQIQRLILFVRHFGHHKIAIG